MTRFPISLLALCLALVFTSCAPDGSTGVVAPTDKTAAGIMSNGATVENEEWTGTFYLCDGTEVEYTVDVKTTWKSGVNNDGTSYYKASQVVHGTATDADGNVYNVQQNVTIHDVSSTECTQTFTQVISLRFIQKGTGKVYHVRAVVKGTIDFCNNTVDYDLQKIESNCD